MKLTYAASLLLLLGAVSAALTNLDTRHSSDPHLSPITLQHEPNQSKSFKCGRSLLDSWAPTKLTVEIGKNKYTGHEIYLAAQYGVALQEAKQTRGGNKYPHPFNNDDSKGNRLSFPSYCPADKNRHEYPLISPTYYNGGKSNKKQVDERVVYYYEEGEIDNESHAKAYYCGIMTHAGAPTGGFKLC